MAGRSTSARQGLAAVLRSFARVLKERNEGRWMEGFHPGRLLDFADFRETTWESKKDFGYKL